MYLYCFLLWAVGMCVFPAALTAQQEFRIMEYNVENLFDCRHDSLKNDHEFLPESVRGWSFSRYSQKLANIAKVILAAGGEQAPDIVGLCEIENEHCVKGLVRYSPLREVGYRYVITRSPDERGIDVALLYQPQTFRLLAKRVIPIPSEEIKRRPTRDILHVTGMVVSGDTLDVFVCHMPSRSGGEKETEPYRLFTSGFLRRAADSIMVIRQSPNVIVMGDFNDYPENRALVEVLGAVKPEGKLHSCGLYNLMAGKPGGTYRFRGEWGMLDQMIVNGFLLGENPRIHTAYEEAQVLRFPFLLEEDERYGGDMPFRTYKGMRYQGGYSDHLPLLLKLSIRE